MRHRDRAQTLEARIAELVALRRSTQAVAGPTATHGPVDRGQQGDIGGRRAPRKGMLGRAVS
ncbi:MAG: hypothetical protein U5L03_00125 [Burkholderiaceae bacterium]|nr:hypothetical protein [Burkholderiaceae bacterium]